MKAKILFSVILFMIIILGFYLWKNYYLPKDIMAMVNNRPITKEMVEKAMSRAKLQAIDPNTDLFRYYMEKLIDEELLLSEAEKRGIFCDDNEVFRFVTEFLFQNPQERLSGSTIDLLEDEEWVEGVKRDLRIIKISSDIASFNERITEAEMLDYYNNHQDEFYSLPAIVFREILVSDLKIAKRIGETLKRDKSAFAQLARRYSENAQAMDGGLIGKVSPEQIDYQFSFLFDLPKNAISEMVKSEKGYHFFQIVDRIEPVLRPFTEVKDEIRVILTHQKSEKILQEWIKNARAKAKIKYYYH